jgi:hypothetical protein
MIRLNVHEAKTHLSRYLDAIEGGETVVLCRRNVPIAEIRRVVDAPREPRPVGIGNQLYGAWALDPAFHEPLPDALLDAFAGL